MSERFAVSLRQLLEHFDDTASHKAQLLLVFAYVDTRLEEIESRLEELESKTQRQE